MSDSFELEPFCVKLKEYDYVRVSVCDIYGHKRGKLIPSREMRRFMSGVSIFSGVCYFGPHDEIALKTLDEQIFSKGAMSALIIPDPKTLHDVKWAGGDKYKIGEVFGEMYWQDSLNGQEACPRNMALKQISRLKDMGYNILSGHEVEFKITNNDNEPINGCAYSSIDVLSKNEIFLMDLESNLHASNVPIEMIHTEYSEGQFEMVMKPEFAIAAADHAFLLKHGLKEMCHQRDLKANFLSRPHVQGCGSGLHLNHSLWDISSKQNAFYDFETEDNLSLISKYWLGGLMKHAKSLCAIFSPTINCYRRMHSPWAPGTITWGFDNRFSAFRVKNNGKNGTYIENRIPSGVANPYLIIAATIAAGIDGIENEIEPPKPMSEDCDSLPHNLEEALEALDSNSVMKKALGEEFFHHFIGIKREIDLKILENHDSSPSNVDQINIEVQTYELL